jgi:hypothetical protein
MGLLRDIENIVNNSINTYSHVKVFPRGLPFFQDSLLRGTVRFGKRTGNSIATINPDNTQYFGAAASVNDTQITLLYPSQWFDVACILSLGPGEELAQIVDVSDEQILTLQDPIGNSYTTDLDNQILLWAFPLVMHTDAAEGATSITVRSHYPLGNGEVFTYMQTPGLLESLFEIDVLTATYNGTSADLYYTSIYTLTLAKPLPSALIQESQVYHRAYPAYFSQPVPVPLSINSAEPVGPFLLDLLSGKIIEGSSVKETFAVCTLNASGDYVLGNSDGFVTVPKNTVILERQVSSDFPMFWELAEGTMRLTPNSSVFIVNQDVNRLFFCCGTRCIPNWQANGNSWRLTLQATDSCTVNFFFHPYPVQSFSCPAGATVNAIVTIPVGTDPVTEIEINVLGQSEICQVEMSDWTPVGNTVTQIQYSLVAQATGIATYQSTGLVVKPFFLSVDFLQATYDQENTTYDGGKVYF